MNTRENFFPKRALKPQNRMPRTVVESSSLEEFKDHVHVALGDTGWTQVDLAVLGKWLDPMVLEVFFSPNDSLIW